MKYIKLFESEYWDKIIRLRDLGLAGEWADTLFNWIERKRNDPENQQDSLDLTDSKLKELPPEISETNSFIILKRSSIERLPAQMKVGGSFWITDCPELSELPEDLTVGRDLVISRCPKLTKLPKRLSVGQDLSIMDVPISTLPEEASVESKLSLIDTYIEYERFEEWVRDNHIVRSTAFHMGENGPREGARLNPTP
jgi:hypothetical protein